MGGTTEASEKKNVLFFVLLLLVGILNQHHTDTVGRNGSSSVIMQTPTDEIFRKDWGDFSKWCMEM